MMEWESEISCSICNGTYSDFLLPRNLYCGHSFCSNCADRLLDCCPECREDVRYNNVSELPINYPLLYLSRMIAYQKPDSHYFQKSDFNFGPKSLEPQEKAGTCSSHGLPLFFMCSSCDVWICRECLVDDHPDPPRGSCSIVSASQATTLIIESCTTDLKDYIFDSLDLRKSVEKRILNFGIAYKFLKKSEDSFASEKQAIIDKVQKHSDNLSEDLQVLESALESLKRVIDEKARFKSPGEMMDVILSSKFCQVALEKLQETSAETPNALDILLRGKKNLAELVEGIQPVYVVFQEEGGHVRWAKLSIFRYKMHMYSLREGSPPSDGITLPFELVRDLIEKHSPIVFLEVGWKGEIKGRVYIQLLGHHPRCQQALLLCSGEKGPSYKNTCFNGSYRKFNRNCILFGGDYENNDGSGGRSFVQGIEDSFIYRKEIKAGLFASWPASEQWRLGSFAVYLYTSPDAYEDTAFGSVVEGLQILRKAGNVTPLSDASVFDCGLVIPAES